MTGLRTEMLAYFGIDAGAIELRGQSREDPRAARARKSHRDRYEAKETLLGPETMRLQSGS